jgi:hypothetical protein
MALLNVVALSEDTIAAPGNRQPNYIVVAVSRPGGAPLTGLVAADFQVDPCIVGAGGALVNIVSANPVRIPGTYIVEVVPIRTETWKSGTYIFAVAVKKGADQGLTLCSVLMD